MYPLSERDHKLHFAQIAVDPDGPRPALPEREDRQVAQCADRIAAARSRGRPVILTCGAHLVKNGLAPVVIRMLEQSWITHVATNGAGSIHDWEFAYLGKSTEDVRANTARGRFGTWDETGRFINLAVAAGGLDGLGYGGSVGRMIAEDSITIPAVDDLRARLRVEASSGAPEETVGAAADLLYLISELQLPPGRIEVPHQFKHYSAQHAAHRLGVPFTVHPGIGYDITHTHPAACGGAIGRGAMWDFLSYADAISRLSGGVHLAVGSAVMAPMIFEKSLSMANNLALERRRAALSDYHLVVVDIQDGGGWDWSAGEPPMDNPAYYLRFCKTFHRMGGTLDYICLDNRAFMLALYKALSARRDR